QGVGFRPFIYRTAVKHGLSGYVRNRRDSLVEIVLEGDQSSLNAFLKSWRRRPLQQRRYIRWKPTPLRRLRVTAASRYWLAPVKRLLVGL
ncbi:MAG TPA: acylphosphatase, partial [Candidatus Latescibacteria bacterium]|nr:acylphosphatase [Candidatus Latescibacterota bacterium]